MTALNTFLLYLILMILIFTGPSRSDVTTIRWRTAQLLNDVQAVKEACGK